MIYMCEFTRQTFLLKRPKSVMIIKFWAFNDFLFFFSFQFEKFSIMIGSNRDQNKRDQIVISSER